MHQIANYHKCNSLVAKEKPYEDTLCPSTPAWPCIGSPCTEETKQTLDHQLEMPMLPHYIWGGVLSCLHFGSEEMQRRDRFLKQACQTWHRRYPTQHPTSRMQRTRALFHSSHIAILVYLQRCIQFMISWHVLLGSCYSCEQFSMFGTYSC